MANEFVLKVATPSTANANSYASGSWTPTALRPYLAAVLLTRGSSSDPVTPTLSGNGITWSLTDATEGDNLYVASGTIRHRLLLFKGVAGASPSAGATTVDCGGVSHTGCSIIVAEGDANIDTSAFVVQTDKNAASGASSIAAALASFADAANYTFACFAANDTGAWTHEGTELDDITYSNPSTRLMAQFLASEDTTPGATYPGPDTLGVIAVEVALGGAVVFGAASLEVTAGIDSAGRKGSYGAASAPFTLDVAAAGFKGSYGAAAAPFAFEVAAAGRAGKYGAAALPLAFDVAAAGRAGSYGAAALPLALTIDSAGRVRQYGAAELGLLLEVIAAGRKGSYGAAELPLLLTIETDGSAGAPPEGGAASLSIGFGVSVAGHAGKYGAAALPVQVAVSSQGRAGAYGAAALEVLAAIASAGRKTAYGSVSLPVVFLVDSEGIAGALVGAPVTPRTTLSLTGSRTSVSADGRTSVLLPTGETDA